MDSGIDLTSIAGIAAFTWVLVAILGRLGGASILSRIAALVQANQELTALVVAVLLALLVKASGSGFTESTCLQVAIQAVTAALVTGFAHDKIMKPANRIIDNNSAGKP